MDDGSFQHNKVETLSSNQKQTVFSFWNAHYPSWLCYKSMNDFDTFLEKQTEKLHYLVFQNSNLCAWSMAFTRAQERWFSIIISQEFQSSGLGTLLLNEMKKDNDALNGWIINHNGDKLMNGLTYQSPSKFYKKNGFVLLPKIILKIDDHNCIKIQWKNSLQI